jgi:hypothetical protein
MKDMVVNIITTDDLEAFKEDFLEQLINILQERQASPMPKWLKTHEVLRILKISPNTLQSLRETGKLPYTKIGGVIYFNFEDIKRMIDEYKATPPKRGQPLPGEKTTTKKRAL